jgi:hypothetical protein
MSAFDQAAPVDILNQKDVSPVPTIPHDDSFPLTRSGQAEDRARLCDALAQAGLSP